MRAAEAAAAAKVEKQNAKFLARQERKEFRKLCQGVDAKLVDQAACPPPPRPARLQTTRQQIGRAAWGGRG